MCDLVPSKLKAHQKDQLLHLLAHYLDQETRRKIMTELPQAYNAWMGAEIMAVQNVAYEEVERESFDKLFREWRDASNADPNVLDPSDRHETAKALAEWLDMHPRWYGKIDPGTVVALRVHSREERDVP